MKNDTVVETGAWLLEHGHRLLLKVSGGRFPRRVLGMQPVELFTTGRKSGLRRGTMLTAPVVEGERVILVASKGGHSSNPAWYLNLVANPEVDLTMGGTERAMLARTATPEEKAELWPRIVRSYKGYAAYQRSTDRDIPVVICEPRP
ncbi:MAG: nitroreductase/quinone reductase family protein [Microthrixaceae bacterium]